LLLSTAHLIASLRDDNTIFGVLLSVDAFLAALLAFSFPGMFLCAGIQKKVIDRWDREEVLSWIWFIISLDESRFFMAKIELRESVTIKNNSVFFQYYSINSIDIRIARASMVKIELYSREENLNISSSDIIAKPDLSLDFDPLV